MFISHELVQLLSPMLIILQLTETPEGAPCNHAANKRTLLYRFGTLYSKENNAHPVTPLFLTPFYTYGSLNKFIGMADQKPISTTSSTPKFTSSFRGTTKQIVIDEQILFQIFNEDGSNKTTASITGNDDFTTEMNIETTTFDTPSTDDDYRFGGGLAAQHAAISLIGR